MLTLHNKKVSCIVCDNITLLTVSQTDAMIPGHAVGFHGSCQVTPVISFCSDNHQEQKEHQSLHCAAVWDLITNCLNNFLYVLRSLFCTFYTCTRVTPSCGSDCGWSEGYANFLYPFWEKWNWQDLYLSCGLKNTSTLRLPFWDKNDEVDKD